MAPPQQASRPRAHRYVLGAVLALLGAAWVLFLVVDVFDVAGSRSVVARDLPTWARVFSEGHVIEWGQWLSLGVAATVAGAVAGHHHAHGRGRESLLWLLIGLSAALFLIEDAGNPSHQFSRWASVVLGDGQVAAHAGRLPVFAVVGGVPAYAVVRYWRELRSHRPAGSFVLAGLACYGFAGVSSVVLNVVTDFYVQAGEFVMQTLLRGRLARVPEGLWGGPEATGWMLMDAVYEESLELVAAGLLLAGAVAAWDSQRRQRAPTAYAAL